MGGDGHGWEGAVQRTAAAEVTCELQSCVIPSHSGAQNVKERVVLLLLVVVVVHGGCADAVGAGGCSAPDRPHPDADVMCLPVVAVVGTQGLIRVEQVVQHPRQLHSRAVQHTARVALNTHSQLALTQLRHLHSSSSMRRWRPGCSSSSSSNDTAERSHILSCCACLMYDTNSVACSSHKATAGILCCIKGSLGSCDFTATNQDSTAGAATITCVCMCVKPNLQPCAPRRQSHTVVLHTLHTRFIICSSSARCVQPYRWGYLAVRSEGTLSPAMDKGMVSSAFSMPLAAGAMKHW